MRRKSISQEEIIDAASRIVKEKGFEACSMRCISKELGIAVGTLYNYYESHELLLGDLFRVSWARTIEGLEDIVKEPLEAKAKLLKYCRVLVQEIKNRHGLGKILFGRLPLSLENNGAEIIVFRRLIELVKEIIKETPKNESLDEQSLDMVARWALLGILSCVNSENCDNAVFEREIVNRFI